jgi:hypothetical protein
MPIQSRQGKTVDPDSEEITFEYLKHQGMKFLQELSGEIWTDHNLHDPGITILEQFCYALTDLAFRAGYNVADILTRKNGRIDFPGLGLNLPDNIFPCRPVTINDYRKLILDAEHRIDNVWMEPVADKIPKGLYQISLKIGGDEKITDRIKEAIRQNVWAVFHANRNLCEDLDFASIEIIKNENVSLEARLEILDTVNPESVLAQVYFHCAMQISPIPVFHSYKEMQDGGKSLEEIFTGPLLNHGYLDDKYLKGKYEIITKNELMGKLKSIDGIKDICSFALLEHFSEWDGTFNFKTTLVIPEEPEEIKVKLRKNGTPCKISFFEFKYELEKLFAVHKKLRNRNQVVDAFYTLPKGKYRNIKKYFSIQNQFPDLYGINQYGISDSAPKDRIAKAKQLKGFLLFFEQIMADFLVNLHHVSDLFSLDEREDYLAWFKALDSDTVPNGNDLYLKKRERSPDETLQEAVTVQLKWPGQRDKILDFLLALYCESCTETSATSHIKNEQLRKKAEFLRHIAEISKNRSGGCNYLAAGSTDSISGLERKIRLLLSLDNDVVFYMLEHTLLFPSDLKMLENIRCSINRRVSVSDDFFFNRISVVFSKKDSLGDLDLDQFQEAVCQNCPAHILPEFHEISPTQMIEFGDVLNKWMEIRKTEPYKDRDSDRLSVALIRFLL